MRAPLVGIGGRIARIVEIAQFVGTVSVLGFFAFGFRFEAPSSHFAKLDQHIYKLDTVVMVQDTLRRADQVETRRTLHVLLQIACRTAPDRVVGSLVDCTDVISSGKVR